VNTMVNTIAKIDKKQFDEVIFTEYKSHYQWFFTIACLLLIIEFLLSERRIRWFDKK